MEHFHTSCRHGAVYIHSMDAIVIPKGYLVECQGCNTPAFRQRYDDMIGDHERHMSYGGYCGTCYIMEGGCISFNKWRHRNGCPNQGDCPTTYQYDGTILRTVRRGDNQIVTLPDWIEDKIVADMPDEHVNSIIVHNAFNYNYPSFIIHFEVRDRQLRPGVLLYANNILLNYGPVQHPRMHLDFDQYPFFL